MPKNSQFSGFFQPSVPARSRQDGAVKGTPKDLENGRFKPFLANAVFKWPPKWPPKPFVCRQLHLLALQVRHVDLP